MFFERVFSKPPKTGRIIEELVAELKDLGRSDRHIYGLRNALAPFAREFPRLEIATDASLAAYLRELAVGPRRRDNILASIVQLSRFARRREYLPEGKRTAAEKVRAIRPASEIETWTAAEAKMILEHVSERWLPFMAIGLFAGLRQSEILRLDWSAIKFEQRVIVVTAKIARKIRTSRLVPISDNLLAWLEPYRDRTGALYPGNFKTAENALSYEWQRIRSETGLTRRDNANRHSYGSHRLAVIKNYEQVSLEMGNSPRMVRENYNDPKMQAEGEAYFEIFSPSLDNVVPMHLPLIFHA